MLPLHVTREILLMAQLDIDTRRALRMKPGRVACSADVRERLMDMHT